MLNYYFKDTIESFLAKSPEEIIGAITMSNQFGSTTSQNKSWEEQIPTQRLKPLAIDVKTPINPVNCF